MGANKVLVLDIGGTNVKLLAMGHSSPRRFAFDPKLMPEKSGNRNRMNGKAA
jgi:hypothetical protein